MDVLGKCDYCGAETFDQRMIDRSCRKDIGKICPGEFKWASNQEELWRDVEGHEGYQVSNMGRIYSKPRMIEHCTGRVQSLRGKVMVGSVNPDGYIFVKFSKDNEVVAYPSIHKVVYSTWIGTIPLGFEIDHINGNKLDNRVSNLRVLLGEDNTSMYFRKKGSRGISYYKKKGKWVARSTINAVGKNEVYLGSYKTKEEAQEAYNRYYIEQKGRMW